MARSPDCSRAICVPTYSGHPSTLTHHSAPRDIFKTHIPQRHTPSPCTSPGATDLDCSDHIARVYLLVTTKLSPALREPKWHRCSYRTLYRSNRKIPLRNGPPTGVLSLRSCRNPITLRLSRIPKDSPTAKLSHGGSTVSALSKPRSSWAPGL